MIHERSEIKGQMPDGTFSYLGVILSLCAAQKPPARLSPCIRKTSMRLGGGVFQRFQLENNAEMVYYLYADFVSIG